MEPKDLFPQPNSNPAHTEAPKTPKALRSRFEKEATRVNVDNYRVETIAPIQNANAADKELYLNKISAKEGQSSLFSKKLLGLVAIAVLLLVAITVGAVLSGGNKVKNASGEALGQRIINLQELVAYGQSNKISGVDVKKVMSEINVVLPSRVNDLTPLYSDDKETGFSSPSPEIASEYSNAQVITELDSAKANSKLDAIYIESLRESMAETNALIKSLYDNSESADLKTALKKTYDDMQELTQRLP